MNKLSTILLLIFSAFYLSISATTQNSITQYGITWYFDDDYTCGQFVTGDWWVVGPVTIDSVSPGPEFPSAGLIRNGSCVNPMAGRQGYDSRIYELNNNTPYGLQDTVDFPCTLQANVSLVSSVSKEEDYLETHSLLKFGGIGVLYNQAILTVVSSSVASGTFRPGYSGTYKQYFTTSQVNMSLLPNLTPPASVPDDTMIIAYTERPRIDHVRNCYINDLCAENNWYNGEGTYQYHCYGQHYSEIVSISALYAMLDVTNKAEVVYNIIQWGIDNYSVLKAGGYWLADGGHNNGRKFPIVFAAILLNDSAMLEVGTTYSDLTGEDNHTYYGTYGDALWGKIPGDNNYSWFLNNCSGSGSKDARDPDGIVDGCPDYRNSQTSPRWVGQMLTTLMIDGKDVWNHDAYFDYIDRWMDGSVTGGGSSFNAFVNDMWDTYRDSLPVISSNLALNKTVTADSEYNASYPAEKAVDGDTVSDASRWLSANASGTHWLEIDLGQTCTVNKVNFWTGYGGYNMPITNYKIQIWNGSSWVDSVDVTSNTQAVVSHTLADAETNKIRLYTTNTSTYIVRLYEIQVWGTAGQLQTDTLTPTADAYVRGGTYASTNYGSSSILYVKDHTSAEYDRETFLKFDLSSISTVVNAYLRLYVNSLDGSSEHSVAFVSDDSWTEGGITFSNKPSSGSSLGVWDVTSSGQYVEVDITSTVSSEAGGTLSLHITSNDGQYIGYDSKEGSNAPELVINDPSKSALISKNKIDLNQSEQEFELWPNPVSLNEPINMSFINYETDESVTISIFDISGKKVYSKNIMDASGTVVINPCVTSGIYILNISNKRFYQNNKFIVE